ncbi:hypothetical protein [Sphingopyxis sp.]|uniref:hypothetical protein n=1 Tax=Sphingopyxis sp. TaxID=1908224 RepID=UPI002D78E960|nr:hypothetical protein [Sphingopyxis sp.]HET6524476.1 hypothetical protein [Sphingopyxis sp.]
MTPQILLGLAGFLSALWLVFHLVQGGKEVVRPLRASTGLDPAVRDTLYMCWHFVTATLAVMFASFVLAIATSRQDLAIVGTSIAFGFTLTGIGQVPAMRARYRDLPQGWLFLPITILGSAGLML